jgi:hypothetical protein
LQRDDKKYFLSHLLFDSENFFEILTNSKAPPGFERNGESEFESKTFLNSQKPLSFKAPSLEAFSLAAFPNTLCFRSLSRQLVELASNVQTATQSTHHYGAETLKASRCAMLVDFTTNYTTSIDQSR